jgi:hypothetical protein
VIRSSFVIDDPTIMAVFNAQPVDPLRLCAGIQVACTGGLQQYPDVQTCVNFITSLPPSRCPFPFTSNTALCRQLHLANAFINPVIHCPHTAMNSPVCFEQCMPDCANCDPNAVCVDDYINNTTAHYKCQCKPGYTGDGVTSCVPNTCANDADCPLQPGSGGCQNGLCGCNKTFAWDTSAGAQQRHDTCDCKADEIHITRDGLNECLPIGKCLDVNDCPQKREQAQCLPTPQNPFATFNTCFCNYGFIGGHQYPCTCPEGRTVVQSKLDHSELCLAPGECTDDSHCAPGTCVQGTPVGHCQ